MVYFEETFEQLDQCEQCLQHLEKGYSEEYVNQFFRYAHSIKGSSDAMGYEEVKDLTHQLEDIWSLIRSKQLSISKDILDISYQAVDIIYQMVENRKNPATEADVIAQLIEKSKDLRNQMKKMMKVQKQGSVKQTFVEETPIQIEKNYSNRYFIQIIIEEENPMPAVTQFLILKNLEDKGIIDYAKPSVEKIRNMEEEEEEKGKEQDRETEFILQTFLSRNELQKEIELGYVMDFMIIDLKEAYKTHALTLADQDFFRYVFGEISLLLQKINEKKPEERDQRFWKEIEFIVVKIHSKSVLLEDHPSYNQLKDHLDMMENLLKCTNHFSEDSFLEDDHYFFLLEKVLSQFLLDAYRMVKNEIIIRYREIKEGQNMTLSFQNITLEMEVERYQLLLIDISSLTKLREDEVKALEKAYQDLRNMGISMFLVHDGTKTKRIHTGQVLFEAMQHLIRYRNEKEMIRKVLTGWKPSKKKERTNENTDC